MSDTAERWYLTYPARPWTSNAERSMHFHRRAALVSEWRGAFKVLARAAKVPPCDRVTVEVYVTTVNRRSMPDPGSCYGAVKAAIDGLVDAGVIPDDRGEQVEWIRLWAAAATGSDEMTLVVSGERAE